jgi:hypothetical protein
MPWLHLVCPRRRIGDARLNRTVRPSSRTRKLAQPRAGYNSHSPATAFPQCRCFDLDQRGLTPAPRYARRPEAQVSARAMGRDMTSFDKREEGFEQKFAHDEEIRFRAQARRNKLVGLWAAEKLGLAGAAAEAYAVGVVAAELEAPGSDAAFRKLRTDFDAKGVAQSDHQIRRTMDELMVKAADDIQAGR